MVPVTTVSPRVGASVSGVAPSGTSMSRCQVPAGSTAAHATPCNGPSILRPFSRPPGGRATASHSAASSLGVIVLIRLGPASGTGQILHRRPAVRSRKSDGHANHRGSLSRIIKERLAIPLALHSRMTTHRIYQQQALLPVALRAQRHPESRKFTLLETPAGRIYLRVREPDLLVPLPYRTSRPRRAGQHADRVVISFEPGAR